MEFRLTVTVTEYGFEPKYADKFLRAFLETHPDVGAVIEQDSESGELSATFSYDAPDGDVRAALAAAVTRGAEIFTDAANATGLPATDFVDAHFEVVDAEDEATLREPELTPA